MKARIRESIRDFETKQARYGAIIELVGDAGGKASAGSKKLVKGIIAVDRLSKRAGFTSFSQFEKVREPAVQTYEFNPNNISKQFASGTGEPVYIVTDPNGNATLNDNGDPIYVNKDGAIATELTPIGQPNTTPDTSGNDPAANPAVVNTGEAAPVDNTGGASPAAPNTGADTAKAVAESTNETAEKMGIKPTDVTIVQGGNNTVGYELIDKKTGEKLQGKYTVSQGRFVPVKVGL